MCGESRTHGAKRGKIRSDCCPFTGAVKAADYLSLSTIAAIVTAAVALLMMNFSRSGRTVDESRTWLKRIVITWIILNSSIFKSWCRMFAGQIFLLMMNAWCLKLFTSMVGAFIANPLSF